MLFPAIIKDNDFNIPGTEGTNEYIGVAKSPLGITGFRKDTARGVYRCRLEVTSDEVARQLAPLFLRADGYKQVGDSSQPRFSITVPLADEARLQEVMARMVAAIKTEAGADWVQANAMAPAWAYAQAMPECEAEERAQMTTLGRAIGLRGINRRWKLATIKDRVATARAGFVAEVRRRDMAGCNLASTWPTLTLFNKLIVPAAGDA